MVYLKATFVILVILAIPHRIDAQYIYEVLDYIPAPGQHINSTAGRPEAAQSIIGTTTGLVSLGAFGGSVIFRFEQPLANNPEHPYGIDFTIFGNSVGDWSEPGIVSVMNDENGNEVADDTWYELAGSEYQNENYDSDYRVTYTNPDSAVAVDVAWEDNRGNSGFVYANTIHTQPYYPDNDLFPGIDKSSYTLEGTRIYRGIDSTDNQLISSPPLAFGYADNRVRGSFPFTIPDNPGTPETEGAGGDPMDISWAVDHNGNSVQLDSIHFIKVHTAVNGHAGILGEVSTEISGAAIVEIATANNGRINPINGTAGYNIYPNPAESFVIIDGAAPARFRITGLSGNIQKEGQYNSGAKKVDISVLPKGVYILQFVNKDRKISKILVKR